MCSPPHPDGNRFSPLGCPPVGSFFVFCITGVDSIISIIHIHTVESEAAQNIGVYN